MKTHADRGRGLVRTLGILALTVALVAACNDDPMQPAAMPAISVETTATAFADADPNIGTDELITVEITNDGQAALQVGAVALEGANAADFMLMDAGPVTLAGGASASFDVGFAPSGEGARSALIVITSNDPSEASTEIMLHGTGVRFQFTQVDRKGIPGLNTVFNHASGVGPFDKTAYNVVTPAGDLATYTGQFETVLGAVGNADPSATAALLLPDELPVSLGAATTAFASLTGRTLSDDAVDVALFVTVGIAELQSDNVDANDKTFLTEFPYVAAPHE